MKAWSWVQSEWKAIVSWLRDRFRSHKKRIAAGLVFLAVELALFFGTGVLREQETHFLTGEGAWDAEMTGENAVFIQEFTPAFQNIRSVSFRMDMSRAVHGAGTVKVILENARNEALFGTEIPYYDIVNCAYTDVELGLKLKPGQSYYLVLEADSAYEGENPLIGVCGTEYALPESRALIAGDVLEGQQLVSRYVYEDAMTVSRMRSAVILSILTALGVMFGLPDRKYLRRAAGVLILIGAPYVLGSRLELLNYDPAFYLPFSMKWNVGIMYVLELAVLLVTHSPVVTAIFTNTALTVLYSANYFMRMYRGTSLRLNDFTAIGTATQVVGEYDLTPNSHLAFGWAILAFIIVWSLQAVVSASAKKEEKSGRRMKKAVLYAVTIALALGMLGIGGHKLLYTDYLNDIGFADKGIRGFEYELIYSFDGYLVATCIEIKNSRITPPDGYSVKRVEEILTQAASAAGETGTGSGNPGQEAETAEYPHIFLIMNESLADLGAIEGVELNEDNLPFIHSMRENTIKGWVNTSVFGGGTANSEFEVFTGCSTAFLSVNYYPYQQAVTGPLRTMVSQLKDNGYTTLSMHPERAANWNRESVYRYFDFDRSLWKEDFPDARIIHSGVSDAETFHKIEELYQNRAEGEKLFVFDLTMQNHGGYTMHEEPYAIRSLNVHEAEVDEYLSLVKISDDAFRELVEYFEKQDEKVLICMYGDHQPFVSDFLFAAGAGADDAAEQMLEKYRTPVVIWANYDIQESDDCNISLNYLGGLVMRTAGVPMSPYFNYLEQLRRDYPIITINGFVDSDGEYTGWSGENNEFAEYRMLQYNYLYDDDKVEWGY